MYALPHLVPLVRFPKAPCLVDFTGAKRVRGRWEREKSYRKFRFANVIDVVVRPQRKLGYGCARSAQGRQVV